MRQTDLKFHSDDSGQRDAKGTKDLCDGDIHAQLASHIVDEAADNTSDRIDFLSEYEWYLVDENIAEDTSRSTRDTAHHNGDPKGIASRQRLFHTDNGEKRQTNCIEYKKCIIQTDKMFTEDDDEYQREFESTFEFEETEDIYNKFHFRYSGFCLNMIKDY